MVIFEMTDPGMMSYFLGMEIDQTREDIFICPKKCGNNILKNINNERYKPISTLLAKDEKMSKDDDSGEVDAECYRHMLGICLF